MVGMAFACPIAKGPDLSFGAQMGEVIQFVPKSELERARLIREARAIYDRIFPSADPASEQRDDTKQ
jgi:hypothetical protein